MVRDSIVSLLISSPSSVVLVFPPSLDFMLAFLACLRAELIAVPVFPPNPLRKDTLTMFAHICDNCGTTVALTNREYHRQTKLASLKEAFRSRRNKLAWPEDLVWITTDTLPSNSSADGATPTFDPDTTAFLQYTSGSTSEPKGVMITHGNLAHNLTIITRELKAKQDTIVVSWLPQYHDMGLIGSYLGCLYCGGTGYYLSPLAFLQRPMLWIEAVSQYKATHLQAPNFAFALTARKLDNSTDLDLSSVRHIINAAEPVDVESMEVFYKTFGKFGLQRVIYPTYGLAEHTVFVCSGGKQHLTVDKQALEVDAKVVLTEKGTQLVGCGYPAHQKVDVQIVDTEAGAALPEDCVGEIWVHSASKAAGYYGKPEESAEDFHAKLEGKKKEYLRTGDLGFLHGGELFICGRLKDLIIVGGRNYYPQDIEATAEATSDLVRLGCSAAFTIDSTREGGEEVALVMELKQVPSDATETCKPLANEIRAAILQEHSLSIAAIAFLEPRTVPKTSSGKIARSWCRKGYVSQTLKKVYHKSFQSTASIAPMEVEDAPKTNASSRSNNNNHKPSVQELRAMPRSEIQQMLKTDVSRVAGLETIDARAPLVTLMDSLTLSQFQGLLETSYGVQELSDEYLFRESTSILTLVDVVLLGHAPDDAPSANQQTVGQATGLAGALGCPPGVVCTIL